MDMFKQMFYNVVGREARPNDVKRFFGSPDYQRELWMGYNNNVIAVCERKSRV